MKKTRLFLLLIALLLSFGLLSACQSSAAVDEAAEEAADTAATAVDEAAEAVDEAAETTLERAQREGVIRVGFANENPYAFAQPDGTLSGEAVEVARAVFQELGIDEMEGVLTEFGSLIPGLQAGRFDVITAGMYITPDRCEQVLFADPEYRVAEGMIVQAGNPLNLHSYSDIAANADATIGTGTGYLEYDYLLEAGVPEDQISTFPDDVAGVAGLQAGQIDAWTGTRPTLLKVLETSGATDLEMADPFEAPIVGGEPVISYGGAAFRYEDQDFRQAFNEQLQALKDSGQLLELIGQFEGFDEGALPGDVTAEDICPDAYSDIQ